MLAFAPILHGLSSFHLLPTTLELVEFKQFPSFLPQIRSSGNIRPYGSCHRRGFLFTLSLLDWTKRRSSSSEIGLATDTNDETHNNKPVRIGIVGGGICGTSVAHYLSKKLWDNEKMTDDKKNFEIVVLEGDPNSGGSNKSPWCAATARNANSIVPGAAMGVFSRKSVLWQVIRDTVVEWYELKKETLQNYISGSELKRQETFTHAPPYFALHPFHCLLSASSNEERYSFLRYMQQYLYATLILGDEEATRRGRYMCDLAKANRDLFLQETDHLQRKGIHIPYTRGFLALYRSEQSAEHSLQTTLDHGEEAQALDWQEAQQKEHHLLNLSASLHQRLHAVYRPNEVISSCENFVRVLTNQIREREGVQVLTGRVEHLEAVSKQASDGDTNNKMRYRVQCQDGSTYEFDVLVLAAGVQTPLLAAQLGVAEYVPTYPLRGFSLTTHVSPQDGKKFLLQFPFSIDSMYCTSVANNMARWAGFGEFVGYPGKGEQQVPSIGPSVLSRYAQAVFPDGSATKEDALWCFRPQSPDDLPIVGPIPKLPGLFVHTGHGTLGWTTGLCTGHCVAQTIAETLLEEEMNKDMGCNTANNDEMYFAFPNGIQIERSLLSPTRFVVGSKHQPQQPWNAFMPMHN